MNRLLVTGALIALTTALFFSPMNAGTAQAGWLNSVNRALNDAANTVTKEAEKLGKEVMKDDSSKSGQSSSSQQNSSSQTQSQTAQADKLPGGVSSRLKKMHQEMDRAENALNKGAGTGVDRATRAQRYIQSAKRFRTEIDKRYAGKFSQDHPDVKAADDRLANLERRVADSGQQAADQVAEAKRKQEADRAAAQSAADAKRQQAAAAEQQAKDARASAEALSDEWIAKLKPFENEKGIIVYATDEADKWKVWNANWAEFKPLWDQYHQTQFPGGKSMSLQGLEQRLTRYANRYEETAAQYNAKQKELAANMGGFVFSKNPIDPANPSGLTDQFEAGDHIYALIKVKKTWSEIYRNKNQADVMIKTFIDGKKIHAQFILLKTPAETQKDFALFEIAPDPGKMKAYTNPNADYGKTTATMRQGPMEMTSHLAKLSPGKHTVNFEIQYYEVWAKGGFTIEGDDFASYGKLHQQVAQAVNQAVTLPQAKMINKSLEKQMKALLENAGWPSVYRVNIVDKDWWIDRVSGGNSPVKSRHMAAAALAKGSDGNYFYKICTFHQHKLITGAFGPLELTHQGQTVPVPEGNIDK